MRRNGQFAQQQFRGRDVGLGSKRIFADAGVGSSLGSQPRAKVSMMIMRHRSRDMDTAARAARQEWAQTV